MCGLSDHDKINSLLTLNLPKITQKYKFAKAVSMVKQEKQHNNKTTPYKDSTIINNITIYVFST